VILLWVHQVAFLNAIGYLVQRQLGLDRQQVALGTPALGVLTRPAILEGVLHPRQQETIYGPGNLLLLGYHLFVGDLPLLVRARVE
jgi:hypothetical protein